MTRWIYVNARDLSTPGDIYQAQSKHYNVMLKDIAIGVEFKRSACSRTCLVAWWGLEPGTLNLVQTFTLRQVTMPYHYLGTPSESGVTNHNVLYLVQDLNSAQSPLMSKPRVNDESATNTNAFTKFGDIDALRP